MPEPAEVARWIQQQHVRVEKLSAKLSGRIAAIPHGQVDEWLSALASEFEHYRAHFEKHMALEERGGYLAPIVETRPSLSGEVDRLLSEHREISHIMTAIYDELQTLSSATPLTVRDCCARIQSLIGMIAHHEEHENMLVTHVFSQDIGLAD